MKLTSIDLFPVNGIPLVLSFRDPASENPYNARLVAGLDSDLIVPKYYGTEEDTKLYNLVRKKRNVGIQIGLNPNYADLETYSLLRDDVYRLVSSSRNGEVRLNFKNGEEIVATILGFVTRLETDLFERDQEIKIMFECRDPMLRSPDRVVLDGTTSDPEDTVFQDDKSTAPHGFIFVVQFTGGTDSFSMTRQETEASFTVRPRDGFNPYDLLHVSSEFDNKYIYLVRDEQIIHLGDVVDLFSIWPLIYPGENGFELTPAPVINWQSTLHYETYWGV